MIELVAQLAARPIAAFVHAGSSSEYGANSAAPLESDACAPNSHYAVSKVAAADFLHYFGKQQAFPCVNLRLYSVYGPLEDPSRLIPNLLRTALDGGLPPLVDPDISRDFVYVDDVCEAFVRPPRAASGPLRRVLQHRQRPKTTIRDLAELARETFGIDAEPVFHHARPPLGRARLVLEPGQGRRAARLARRDAAARGPAVDDRWVAGLRDEQMASRPRRSALDAAQHHRHHRLLQRRPAIPVMYERLSATFRKLGVDYEIIFVNDGSPDDSAEVIRKISERDPRVIGISHSRNFGSQTAFRSGMEVATKDSVVLLDGDLQDPPELIEPFFEQWQAGYDVVYGRRVKREMPWHVGIQYKLFYRIFAAFATSRFRTTPATSR